MRASKVLQQICCSTRRRSRPRSGWPGDSSACGHDQQRTTHRHGILRQRNDVVGYFERANQAGSGPVAAKSPGCGPEAAEYGEYYTGDDKGFFYWLKAGFAFTLPILILGVLALLIWVGSFSAK